MGTQVITIGSSGSVSGLERKPKQGVDLKRLGKATVERASLIEWDTDAEAWYVNVLQEHGRGRLHARDFGEATGITHDYVAQLGLSAAVWRCRKTGELHFDQYDDAVKAEVAFLDALRLKGLH